MTIELFPLNSSATIKHNTGQVELIELAIRRAEGQFAACGALAVETGAHTGRSAQDKYVVRDAATEKAVWWDNNKSMTPEQFDLLLSDFREHANSRELFVQDLFAGADPAQRLNARIFVEYAWHALFIRHLLRRPEASELAGFNPQFTVVNLPSFRADPKRHGVRSETVIACNFAKRLVLIGGSSYAGETKKSVFTYLNYVMPETGVMPMHCSANVGTGGDAAVFFGLSGTGKTTLSADPKRILLGDDEHGWSQSGIYNFEGGCYAKTIRLSEEAEPEIWNASNRFGTVLENVILKPGSREPDFDDGRLTENTRSAYPLDFISNASKTGTAGHPKNIVMLTADAFGILPPIAKLSPSQAMYHFLSGYTAKVAGTEKGLGNEPQATFSTCFGAPFMPRHPSVYGNLLRELIAKHKVDCWLVNTGWTGGKYGTGRRMPIKATRALLDAALSGALKSQPMRTDPVFGFQVPT
ncbi:MAG: phosphoenolpyruvate carboxykinase, partial [Hyphomicrobiaceae bacterium]